MADITTVDVPEFIDDSQEYDTEYKPTMKWDPAIGDFVRDGANKVQECRGEEGFMVWCMKTAMTERYACSAYPDEIGVEMESAMSDDEADVVESQVERTITEALEVNPRTERVYGFEFSWNGDEMHVSFKVKGVEWDDIFEISI